MTLITPSEWELFRESKSLPSDADPSHYGFMIYWSIERVGLIQRLNDHWKS